jgi:hypothetical protein
MLRVYYAMYHDGDFLKTATILPGTVPPKDAEAWGRAAAAATQDMVARHSPVAVLPALPGL